MQWFTRRAGKTIVVGVDKALAMLQHASGYFEDGKFISTADRLQVGPSKTATPLIYDGNPLHVQPVILAYAAATVISPFWKRPPWGY
jgi:nicotinate phosphoribosyltransferase